MKKGLFGVLICALFAISIVSCSEKERDDDNDGESILVGTEWRTYHIYGGDDLSDIVDLMSHGVTGQRRELTLKFTSNSTLVRKYRNFVIMGDGKGNLEEGFSGGDTGYDTYEFNGVDMGTIFLDGDRSTFRTFTIKGNTITLAMVTDYQTKYIKQ